MKTKFKYTLLNLYTEYCKKVEKPVDIKNYKKFYDIMGKKMFECLIDGQDVKLPYFGILSIYQKRPRVVETKNGNLYLKGYRPDWKKSKDKWKELYPTLNQEELKKIKNKPIIFHTNELTGGKRFYLDFNKKTTKLISKKIIDINFVRDKNRLFNKIIQNEKGNFEYKSKK